MRRVCAARRPRLRSRTTRRLSSVDVWPSLACSLPRPPRARLCPSPVVQSVTSTSTSSRSCRPPPRPPCRSSEASDARRGGPPERLALFPPLRPCPVDVDCVVSVRRQVLVCDVVPSPVVARLFYRRPTVAVQRCRPCASLVRRCRRVVAIRFPPSSCPVRPRVLRRQRGASSSVSVRAWRSPCFVSPSEAATRSRVVDRPTVCRPTPARRREPPAAPPSVRPSRRIASVFINADVRRTGRRAASAARRAPPSRAPGQGGAYGPGVCNASLSC